MGARIAGNGEKIHVSRLDASHAKTFGDGHRGKAGDVLDPAEPLFFDRCNQLPITDEAEGQRSS